MTTLSARSLRTVVVVAIALALSSSASAANGPEDLGITLLPSADKIGEHRYTAGRDYEATTKFFREKFRGLPKVRTYREVSVSNVKYVHYENSNETSAWQGINVYQLKNGQVRIYMLPRVKAAATSTATAVKQP